MNKQILTTAVLMTCFGLLAGYWLGGQKHSDIQPEIPAQEKEILFYRNPMNPEITSPVPAKDSMGMDYIAVYSEQQSGQSKSPAGTVEIDGITVQNIGVRTAVAKHETLSHIVRAVGRVAYDEERMLHLHPKTEGWVEELNIDKTGQWVEKNADLLSIYSPKLVTSQQEYILALKNLQALKDSPFADIRRGAEELLASSLQRLKLLDVPEHQLHDLKHKHKIKKSLHIHSPAEGVVMKIGAREGQFVSPETEIYMIADLRKIWVYADIYEYELPWVKQGDAVEIQLAGIPGRTFHGHLGYIYPYADAKTRTIKVRLVFDNPDLLLKPDMFADVTIFAGQQHHALIIPSEAVIRSGSRNQVFVVRAAGKFEPRQVTLGLAANGKVSVINGLKAGETVVSSAQFLIDSESKLREATAKMQQYKHPDASQNQTDETDPHAGHQHMPEMNHQDMKHD